jgi:glycosyltransferase involved in cell wall biosynthesis
MYKTADLPILTRRPPQPAQPLVSVVIVCYNQAHYLAEAIRSALAQDYQDLEVLVVDDGSTDETAEVAQAFPRVRYIRQDNRGLAAARNTGLRESTGQYLLFLDADDRLLPNAVLAGVDCFGNDPNIGLVFGEHRKFYSDGSPAPTEVMDRIERDHYWYLLQGNLIGMHGAVLYSRVVLEAVAGFDESLKACEDYELYLRISRRWRLRQHHELVAEYRLHDTNMSRDIELMLRSVLTVLQMEQRRVPDSRHRQALQFGIHVWKEYYGGLLIDEWKHQKNLPGFLRLLRFYPSGVLRRGGKWILRRITARLRRGRLGTLRGLSPVSRRFGLDRGQPVDRHYIESFLVAHKDSVRGCVLEIGDDSYSRKFGGNRITRQDILHVVPGYPGATIIADLANAPHLPPDAFDCIILTQTLHYIYDIRAAVATLSRILKPGGTLLVTLPGISPVCRDQQDSHSDSWRFTASSAQRLFKDHFPGAAIEVKTYGNVLAATAFLYGLAAHELAPAEIDHHDPDYPVTIAVAVKRREIR